jgi:hypothetical protein
VSNPIKINFARLVTVILLVFTLNAPATVRYVDLNCTNSASPYTSWATAATNIQSAINIASASDTILVTNGVYQTGNQANSGANRVNVWKALMVQSVNGPALTVIKGAWDAATNGPNAVRCVYLVNGATLSGFTLTNGATQVGESGGGVKCQSTNAVVTNCVITANATSGAGGGVNSGSLINCILTGNAVVGFGSGGGAYQSVLINCTLTGNTAYYYGGGSEGDKLVNCVVYYNNLVIPSDGNTNHHSSTLTNCCTIPLPFSGANNITSPPLFQNQTGGDLRLHPASPCINAGNNLFITSGTDLDGNPRVITGTVDIGAYEFQSPIHFVKSANPTPVSPYTNWISAATNIQDAIDVASAGEFIVVSNGTYKTGGRAVYSVMTNRVVVNKAVTVQSVNGPSATTIEGLPDSTPAAPLLGMRCVYLTNGAALVGFTLTKGGSLKGGDGVRAQSGGGVWCESSSAIISNCVFAGNAANQFGGGAFQGTLLNCILTNNAAAYGGGACSNFLINCLLIRNKSAIQNLNWGGGAAYCTLSNCLIVGNQSVAGGGYGAGAAFSTLTSCVVSNNGAGGLGGGLYFGVVNNSLISSNRASLSGGGAYSNVLNNCILIANDGGKFGGGAYQSMLNNCKLVNNAASDFGGGAYGGILNNCTVVSNSVYGPGGGVAVATVNNCIIYFNTNKFNAISPNFTSSTMNYCCSSPLPTNGVGNITNEPVFLNLAGGDFHLQTNSPCINSGKNSYVINSTDLDGLPRIAGGTVDIGAFEFQLPGSILSYAWAQQYGLPTDGTADNTDSDGDGFNTWQEWHIGTNPTNSASLLQMQTTASDPSGVIVTWQSAFGINYLIDRSTNLTAQPAFQTLVTNIGGSSGTTSYLDTTATNGGPYFYRVGVQ